MFAMDTTGSMSEDIGEAVQIANDIVTTPIRDEKVNYVLARFNDPGMILLTILWIYSQSQIYSLYI